MKDLNWNEISENETVISLLKERMEIERKIQCLDKNALMNFELKKLMETI